MRPSTAGLTAYQHLDGRVCFERSPGQWASVRGDDSYEMELSRQVHDEWNAEDGITDDPFDEVEWYWVPCARAHHVKCQTCEGVTPTGLRRKEMAGFRCPTCGREAVS